MAFYLQKYDDANGRYRPVNEANDTFGFLGLRLGGDLFDKTNIALKSEVSAVQGNLAALISAYNTHAYVQAQDIAALRADITSLYDICKSLGVDINAIMDDLFKEQEIIATEGQTIFQAISPMEWSEYNDVVDLWVRRNGQVISVDTTGGTGRDYRKLSNSIIELTMTDNPVYAGEIISIRVERSLLNVRFNAYFYNNNTGYMGRGLVSPNRYTPNSEKLMVWRNGLLLCKSNSYGLPVDRYEETTSSMITLGEALITSDIVSLLNRTTIPQRAYQTGTTASVLTVPNFGALGNNRLKVFRNGILMNNLGITYGDPIDRYVETTTSSITLETAAVLTDIFAFEVNSVAPEWMEVQTGFASTVMNFAGTITDINKLLVFRNGRLMYNSLSLGLPIDQYVQSGPSSITLQSIAETTDWFAIIYNGM